MPNTYLKVRKKTLAKLFGRMVFLALMVAGMTMRISAQDGHCSRPNDTLGPLELNPPGCQQHVQEKLQYWHRMKCGNETPTSIDKICCSSWCEQLTSCFSQERSWKEDCVRMWRCRTNEKPREQFSIILTNKTDSSYLGRIKVKQCWARKPKFPAIKLTPSSEFSNKKLVDTILKEVIGSSDSNINQEKMERTFLTVTDLEEFIGNYAQSHLNQTVPKIDIRSEHAGSVVLCVIYKDLHKVFLKNQTDSAPVNNFSNILSATIWPRNNTFRKNITLRFRNLADAPNRSCVFWNTLKNSWSGQGCLLTSRNESYTECSCNHLTHFAVLMQFVKGTSSNVLTKVGILLSIRALISEGTKTRQHWRGTFSYICTVQVDGVQPSSVTCKVTVFVFIFKTDEKALEILTYVGLSLSLVGITLTIISYAVLTDMKGPLSQTRVSLVASLGAGQIIFLAGIGAVENKSTCVIVAAFVQYFLMAAFCWMFIEGVYLYLFAVKVYNINDKMKISHGFSWGLPAFVVSISLGIAARTGPGIKSYVSETFCWMSSSNGMIWIFVVFVVLIELLNTLILVRVIKEMTNMQHVKDKIGEQIRLGVRACVLMIPLLGITWLFGLLSPLHRGFAYIFTIFNSTQGFLIFLLHCVKNSEIRSRFKGRINGVTPTTDEVMGIKRAAQVNETISVILSRK